jgi:GTP-binding protein HflX
VSIAGYTNAGKSSLLNRLTQAGVLVQNQLFATLDPTVRRSSTPDGREFTLADTVGFVRSLPTQLVEAFRSTLEEVGASDVIVHVVDGAHPDPGAQLATVRDVIGEVGARDLPEIVVFNKADLVDDDRRMLLRGLEPGAIFVSARTGEGIEELRERIAETLPQWDVELDLLVPYDRGDVVALAHQRARVVETEYEEEGTRIRLVATERIARMIQAASAVES